MACIVVCGNLHTALSLLTSPIFLHMSMGLKAILSDRKVSLFGDFLGLGHYSVQCEHTVNNVTLTGSERCPFCRPNATPCAAVLWITFLNDVVSDGRSSFWARCVPDKLHWIRTGWHGFKMPWHSGFTCKYNRTFFRTKQKILVSAKDYIDLEKYDIDGTSSSKTRLWYIFSRIFHK